MTILIPNFRYSTMASDEIEKSEVRQFYDGKTIFITGATGFMGKVGSDAHENTKQRPKSGSGRKASQKHKCEKTISSYKAEERIGDKCKTRAAFIV